MATVAEKLLTAEEFARMPDPGYPTELVRGGSSKCRLPARVTAKSAIKVGRLLGNHAEDRDLGHVLNNDSGVITERGPDSVRGPDVAYYSFERKCPRIA